MSLSQVKEALMNSSEVVIVSHEYPDGDSIGSSIALRKALIKLGKAVKIVIDSDVPTDYFFLKGSLDIKQFHEVGITNDITIIFLDCADEKRAGSRIDAVRQEACLTINIDHHTGNTEFGHLNYVESTASSTGELVYKLIKALGVEIDHEIANALYVALVTDTGSFRFDNTTAETLEIASQLIALGADLRTIRINLWESKSYNSIRLLVDVLSTIKFACNGKIAYIVVPTELIKKWNVSHSQLESFVNYPKSIQGVEVAIIFKQLNKNETRVSFRAKNDINVQLIAFKFGGGGHKKASGCTIKTQLDDAVKMVITYLETAIQ